MASALAQRFILLLAVSLAGIALFAVAGATLMWQTGVHGRISRRISEVRDLTSAIEPPPLYLVEAMLVAHELTDASDPAGSATRFAALQRAFESDAAQWQRLLTVAGDANAIEAFAAVVEPAHRFFAIATQDLRPALARGDRAAASACVSGPMSASFRAHREAVLRFMEVLQRLLVQAEDTAHAIQVAIAIGMGGVLVTLLAAARGLYLVRSAHQQEILERETRYRYLSEASFEGIAVIDRGMLIDCNQQLARMLGYGDPAALIGRPLSERIAPEHRSQFLTRIAEHSEEDCELVMLRGDGSPLDGEARTRYCDLDGRRLRMTAIRDITRRKRDERDLIRYRDHLEEQVAVRTADLERASREAARLGQQAEAASRAKSEFLANMSHEIRTPLNAVLGYAQLLVRDRSLAPANHSAVEVINRSGEHLLSLISDILEMSRIEAGRITTDAEDFDLQDLLDNLRSLFLLRARDKGLELNLAMAVGMPRFFRADQRKLRQILVNLLSNAVKFTVAGAVEVAVAFADGRLRVAVSDSGPGMTAEEVAGLFEPFVQAGAGRRRGEGSGLGLAISRGFARSLGGDLTITSQPGCGSTFVAIIPATTVDSAAKVRRQARRVLGLAPGSAPPRVLVAEDHGASRELLHELMTSMGIEVRSVADGAAAVEVCREWRPDLVWMDVDMPVMDGLCAARAIRAASGPTPAIVALTAAAFAEDRTRILASGCDDVAHKPYREEELFTIMERVLGIGFLWQDEAAPAAGAAPAVLPAALASLPETDRAALYQAAITGDLAAIVAMTGAWSDRGLAAGIRALAEGMALERIIALVEPLRAEAAGGAQA